MDLKFPGFVANLKLDCMAETICTELGKNLDLRRKFAQKGALTLPGTFGKVRFNVARSLWIDHVAIFNNFRQVVPIGQCFDEWDYC